VNGWDRILVAARAQRDVFNLASAAPRASQRTLLWQILRSNAGTEFGRAHRFEDIRSVEEFRSRVPIRSYEELGPWLDRVSAGQAGVLTREPVIAFEETGGSRAGRKLVPYTSSSLLAFRAAVLPWLADLADRRPAAFAGKAYVAISPAARRPRSVGGIPVGLASEGAYLGEDLASALMSVLVVPPMADLVEVDEWRFATLTCLLASPDLTMVSVWSPTFLIGLLDAVPRLAEPLLGAIRNGMFGMPPDPGRARDVEAALARNPIDTARLWPRLDTVSAWTDGPSRFYAQRLVEMFPHASVQPKGLLATEGAVTTPCTASCTASWPVPALNSAFLEFIDDAGRPLLCDELHEGHSYRVVLTNPGGFYRYDLGDRLRCRGHSGQLPLLEFIGRDTTSDMVGEKLSESFVSEALSSIDRVACLAPRATAKPFYELLVETRRGGSSQPVAALVDERLCANPQYAYARRVGQLGPVVLRDVDRLLDRYTSAQVRRGRRLADIKPPTVIYDAGVYATLINQVDSGISGYQPSLLPA
jgi:hypothetical protein